MRAQRFTLSVMLIAGLTACGGMSSYVAPPANERLVPDITAEGTKFFVLQRDYLRPDPYAADATPARPRGRGGDELIMGERNIEQRLTLIMERTGYCREGFFELYREQTLTGFSVRGECRETASDADRARFSSGPIPL